jgi:hypothetical protein
MRLSIFVEKQKDKDVFVVSGKKFLAISEDVFLDGKNLELGTSDWLELDAAVVRLENRIPHESIKYLYKEIHIYTLPFLIAKEVTEQIEKSFGEEKEMALRVKVVGE